MKNGEMVYCSDHKYLLDRYEHGVFVGDVNIDNIMFYAVIVNKCVVTKGYVLKEEEYKEMKDNVKLSNEDIINGAYTIGGKS